MPQSGFPRALLEQSAPARLAYFKSFTMAHPLLKEADTALKHAIEEPAGGYLIFVYGPTGVGKTTLRLRLEKYLKESLRPVLEENPGRVPVVSMEAPAPDSSQFSWKDYYKRALMALEEPLVDHKISYQTRGVSRDGRGKLTVDSRAIGAEMRQALESALVHRRPAAFFIDEAQHLTKMKSGRKLQDQLDSIKSLASLTGTVHVLIGTYELLPFRNLSAQLTRRSIDIHFRRYHANRAENYRTFQNVLFTCQRHLPLVGASDLLPHSEFCYERSIGCVGVLKDWLTRALAIALVEDSRTLTLKTLQQTAWSLNQSVRMAKEAVEGEGELSEKSDSQNQLRKLLGLEPILLVPQSTLPPSVTPLLRSAPPRGLRVGQRKPARDVVGAHQEV